MFAFLAGLWTAFVAASVALIGWAVSALGSGRAGELATGAADWPVPTWMDLWIDPAVLKAMQTAGLAMAQWLAEGRSNLSGVMDWFTPLMWMGWGVVLVLLLVVAVALHWLVGRLQNPTPEQRLPA